MTPDQTVTFIEALQRRCTEMGWNTGTKNITSFCNKDKVTVDIIKSYGQINEATLRSACERFCSAAGTDSRTRARQNNTMMSVCLAKSLTADAQARLLTYRKDYLIEGIECAPLMYKVIMRLATIDSVATTQALRDNLQALGSYASTVSGAIDKINTEFDKIYSQLEVPPSTTQLASYLEPIKSSPALTSRPTSTGCTKTTSTASFPH